MSAPGSCYVFLAELIFIHAGGFLDYRKNPLVKEHFITVMIYGASNI
jgi:hypothetical protein